MSVMKAGLLSRDNDTVIGIDPGKDGFVTILKNRRILVSVPTPVIRTGKTRRDYDVGGMVDLLIPFRKASLVVLEVQQAMPRQGGVSMFTIGHGYGLWQGIVAALQIPYLLVRPKTWQREMLEGVPGSDTKARSILKAKQLFPEADLRKTGSARSKDHHGKSDSILMAVYGLQRYLPKVHSDE